MPCALKERWWGGEKGGGRELEGGRERKRRKEEVCFIKLTAANMVPLIRFRASSPLLYELANYKSFSTFIYFFFINPSVLLLLCVFINLNIHIIHYLFIAFTFQISTPVFNQLRPQKTKRESRRL